MKPQKACKAPSEPLKSAEGSEKTRRLTVQLLAQQTSWRGTFSRVYVYFQRLFLDLRQCVDMERRGEAEDGDEDEYEGERKEERRKRREEREVEKVKRQKGKRSGFGPGWFCHRSSIIEFVIIWCEHAIAAALQIPWHD